MKMEAFFLYIETLIIIFIFYGKSTNSLETYKAPSGEYRQKRSVVNLYQMVKCSTNCDPVTYKGYGCYCGFMGDGYPVDDIDRCCQSHDKCYSKAAICTSGLHYFTPYDFKCSNGEPICKEDRGYSRSANCGNLLCECDRAFVACLKDYPCPTHRPVCTSSPWSFLLRLGPFGRKIAVIFQFLF